jgi:hypothetical protein
MILTYLYLPQLCLNITIPSSGEAGSVVVGGVIESVVVFVVDVDEGGVCTSTGLA